MNIKFLYMQWAIRLNHLDFKAMVSAKPDIPAASKIAEFVS